MSSRADAAAGGRRIHGEVMVASLVTLFKKLKFVTDENVGWGPIDLPELELQTTAYWLTAEGLTGRWRRDDLDVALLGAGRAIQAVAGVLLMVDPRDLGLVTRCARRTPRRRRSTCTRRSPAASACPSGCSHATTSWSSARRRSSRHVGCEAGCPACTGPRLEPTIDGKALALRLLAAAASRPAASVAPADRGPVPA